MGRHHLKLTVFHKSDELVVLVYRLTRDFPADERYGLRSQLRRATLSMDASDNERCRTLVHEVLKMFEKLISSLRALRD